MTDKQKQTIDKLRECERKIIEENRRLRKDKPIGPHWESVGVYLGDGMYGDPDYFGLPAEHEILGI